MSEETETVNVPVNTVEALSENIAVIADATRTMMAAGMKRKTIIYLLSRSSGVGIKDVGWVLDAMETMDEDFLTDAGRT